MAPPKNTAALAVLEPLSQDNKFTSSPGSSLAHQVRDKHIAEEIKNAEKKRSSYKQITLKQDPQTKKWIGEDAKAAVKQNPERFKMSDKIYKQLYRFQVQGVEWLWGLYTNQLGGGVLGDDMGMGKTVQVCAFLGAMWRSRLVGKVLLVVPASLITNWERAIEKWCQGLPVNVMIGEKSYAVLNKIRREKRLGVVLTTYETLRARVNKVVRAIENDGDECCFGITVLDEGHRIKNHKSQISKAVREIPSKLRVVVTGTPMQNNLTEFWAIFDFVKEGLLGDDLKLFRSSFERPILMSREKGASLWEKQHGEDRATLLRFAIAPFFLRRKKSMMDGAVQESNGESKGACAIPSSKLPKKRDIVIWTKLAEKQEDLYRKFLGSKEVRQILSTSNNPLAGLTVCKKLCDHPQLCKSQWEAYLNDEERETDVNEIIALLDSLSIGNSTEYLLTASSKLLVLQSLLHHFTSAGHRTVVFSRSTMMLNIIQNVVKSTYSFCRIDGNVPASSRQSIIDGFNDGSDGTDIMLISKGVGGVGLTLTGADRVILYDPDWNPVIDEQSVDRIYRIGQTKDVVCCRLVTCGTIEDKMYRRQVYKSAIAEMVTKGRHMSVQERRKDKQRHFSKRELRELFSYDPSNFQNTLKLLQSSLRAACRADSELNDTVVADQAVLKEIEELKGVVGLSRHDLVQVANVHNAGNIPNASTARQTGVEMALEMAQVPSPPRKSSGSSEAKDGSQIPTATPEGKELSADSVPLAFRARNSLQNVKSAGVDEDSTPISFSTCDSHENATRTDAKQQPAADDSSFSARRSTSSDTLKSGTQVESTAEVASRNSSASKGSWKDLVESELNDVAKHMKSLHLSQPCSPALEANKMKSVPEESSPRVENKSIEKKASTDVSVPDGTLIPAKDNSGDPSSPTSVNVESSPTRESSYMTPLQRSHRADDNASVGVASPEDIGESARRVLNENFGPQSSIPITAAIEGSQDAQEISDFSARRDSFSGPRDRDSAAEEEGKTASSPTEAEALAQDNLEAFEKIKGTKLLRKISTSSTDSDSSLFSNADSNLSNEKNSDVQGEARLKRRTLRKLSTSSNDTDASMSPICRTDHLDAAKKSRSRRALRRLSTSSASSCGSTPAQTPLRSPLTPKRGIDNLNNIANRRSGDEEEGALALPIAKDIGGQNASTQNEVINLCSP